MTPKLWPEFPITELDRYRRLQRMGTVFRNLAIVAAIILGTLVVEFLKQ